MSKADEFLSAFNEIEHYCKRKLQATRYETFSQTLKQLDQSGNSVIRRFKDDLLEYAELRNAIVHSKRGEEVIAYPTEAAVRDIVRIKEQLLHPPLIKSLFGKAVKSVSVSESLDVALTIMKAYDISQVPVLNGKEVVEVINGNTIARWLSNQDIISPQETKVEELFVTIERKKNFKIVAERTDVYACAELFSGSLHKGWYLDAVLMTHSGKNSEGLTGIVVLEDIARYLQ